MPDQIPDLKYPDGNMRAGIVNGRSMPKTERNTEE